ncbi:TetR family transcriptional regulator [Gryllotalpicola koreensis]|uniref:TetR family transcriptional regulator n=1 Tax=Gryllotalpicola koreensis TaxID=993086 RepID=A0ABP7ZY34_9MICO
MTVEQTPRKRPTGRRGGDSGTRDDILDAARDLFAERGYDGASIRAIAMTAGVDPALIRHFFGDKDNLFATTVADRTAIPQRIAESLAGDLDTIGRRVTDAYLRMWEEDDTRPVLLSLVRSAVTSDRAAEMLLEILGSRARSTEMNADFTDERMRRIALAAAHLFGIAVARHVIKIPPIAELSHDTLVDDVSPAIQRYLTGT